MDEEQFEVTTNHDQIRKWVRKYNGKPAIIDDVAAKADRIGLRIEFFEQKKKKNDEFLSKRHVLTVTWNKFFEIFDDQELAFMYADKSIVRDPTLKFRFIKKDNITF